MGQDVWLELLPGLLLVVGIAAVIRGGSGWMIFRRSIYKELYSNYFEYAMRRKSIFRLSKSYYLESRFGAHRIYYQLAAVKGKQPQAYVVVLLTSGMYILNIKNQTGDIEAALNGDFRYESVKKGKRGESLHIEVKKMKNPLEETAYFRAKILDKLKNERMQVRSLVVFPDASTLKWKNKKEPEKYSVIHRRDVYRALKALHESREQTLGETDIDRIYLTLAGDVLEAEKRENKFLQKGGE